MGISLVAVLRENIPEEARVLLPEDVHQGGLASVPQCRADASAAPLTQVKQFSEDFWPNGEVYLDETDALYKAIGGGDKKCADVGLRELSEQKTFPPACTA